MGLHFYKNDGVSMYSRIRDEAWTVFQADKEKQSKQLILQRSHQEAYS